MRTKLQRTEATRGPRLLSSRPGGGRPRWQTRRHRWHPRSSGTARRRSCSSPVVCLCYECFWFGLLVCVLFISYVLLISLADYLFVCFFRSHSLPVARCGGLGLYRAFVTLDLRTYMSTYIYIYI